MWVLWVPAQCWPLRSMRTERLLRQAQAASAPSYPAVLGAGTQSPWQPAGFLSWGGGGWVAGVALLVCGWVGCKWSRMWVGQGAGIACSPLGPQGQHRRLCAWLALDLIARDPARQESTSVLTPARCSGQGVALAPQKG